MVAFIITLPVVLAYVNDRPRLPPTEARKETLQPLKITSKKKEVEQITRFHGRIIFTAGATTRHYYSPGRHDNHKAVVIDFKITHPFFLNPPPPLFLPPCFFLFPIYLFFFSLPLDLSSLYLLFGGK